MDNNFGRKCVQLARRSIEYFMHMQRKLSPVEVPEDKEFQERKGVFVTLKNAEDNTLRGCIGFPEAIKPLWETIMDSAINAAFNDPRFPALTASELENILVEVSILTKPEEIKTEKKIIPSQIEIGKDGLIVERGNRSGLLLPDVAVEWKWNAEQFLEAACQKAGLLAIAWRESRTKVYKFQTRAFVEEKPKGNVLEI